MIAKRQGCKIFAQGWQEKKRICGRAMSMSGGYAFIRYNGNLACIISVPLTLWAFIFGSKR